MQQFSRMDETNTKDNCAMIVMGQGRKDETNTKDNCAMIVMGQGREHMKPQILEFCCQPTVVMGARPHMRGDTIGTLL